MAFYSKPFDKALSDNRLSSTDKLILMVIEGWYTYYRKNKPEDVCTVFISQLCKQLCLEISDVISACRKLKDAGYVNSYPENNQKGSKKIIVLSLDLDGGCK